MSHRRQRMSHMLALEGATATARPPTHRSQDSLRSGPANLKVLNELVQRHAIGQPVEQLLHRQAAAAEARGAAHAARVHPYGLLKGHRSIPQQALGYGIATCTLLEDIFLVVVRLPDFVIPDGDPIRKVKAVVDEAL